jgi:hypothetical protein
LSIKTIPVTHTITRPSPFRHYHPERIRRNDDILKLKKH